jgi:hypothetical protein
MLNDSALAGFIGSSRDSLLLVDFMYSTFLVFFTDSSAWLVS